MFKAVSKKFALSLSVLSIALGILLLPATSFTAEDYNLATTTTPTAYLEKSQIIGTGKQINVYRVPTMDNSGNVGCYDLTIKFGVTSTGRFKTAPTVTATECPNVPDNTFIAGTYTGGSEGYNCGAVTCNVSTSVLSGGRMEVALSCQDTNCAYTFSASAVSGLIKGHPFEIDLLTAGIDKITGYQQYSWGKLEYSRSTWWNCFDTGDVISARQIGNTIVLSGYDKGNEQKCGVTLVKK